MDHNLIDFGDLIIIDLLFYDRKVFYQNLIRNFEVFDLLEIKYFNVILYYLLFFLLTNRELSFSGVLIMILLFILLYNKKNIKIGKVFEKMNLGINFNIK